MDDTPRSLRKVEEITKDLEHVTQNLDEDMHKLLKGEEEVETELKNELKEDEELEELTNKGLQAVEQLEEVEKKLEKHERAAEKGVDSENIGEVLGHVVTDLSGDVQSIRSIMSEVKNHLERLESESDSEAQEVHSFEDIMSHLSEGIQKANDLDKRMAEISK